MNVIFNNYAFYKHDFELVIAPECVVGGSDEILAFILWQVSWDLKNFK